MNPSPSPLNEATGKDHTCFDGCLEVWCATDELDKLWIVEYELMEECYLQVVMSRRGASNRATRSSKYTLTPLKIKQVREGRTERAEEDVGAAG